MKLLVVACLISAALATDCSEGQAVWCSSIEAAKECDAINHCKDTVWKNVELSEDSSDVCTFCETIMGDVVKFLQDGKEQGEIQKFLEGACQVIPVESVQQECVSLIENDLPILLMLISEELEPKLICGLMGMCKSNELFKIPQKSMVRQVKVKATGDICADCKAFFGDIKDEITSETTEEQLEQMIDNLLCDNLGPLADDCKKAVADYVPVILQMIADEYDPAQDCQVLGFCSMTEAARAIIPTLRLKKSQLYSKMKGNDEYCDACKEVINEIKSLDQDPSIQSEIENMIDQYLCSQLGEIEDLCKQEVKQYLPEILQLLASELDPEQDCEAIGFCSAYEYPLIDITQSKITDDDIKAMRESGPKMAVGSGSSIQCVLCEYVMSTLDNMLTKNATEQEIIAALDKVCSILPGTVSAECEDFVNTYGPAVLTLLAQEISADQVCTLLGLCSSKVADEKDEELCLVCETLVQYVDSLISENATQAEIKQVLDKVCNFLPDTFKAECVDLVNQYEPMLIQLVEKELTPKEVCTELSLCSALEKLVAAKVVDENDEEFCLVCETLVQYVDSTIGENATQAEIKAVLDKVCHYLPNAYQAECIDLVKQYEPMLIQLLQKELSPKEVCTEIGLCSADEEIIVPEKQPLLGEKECSWGPAYWCASKENAAKCRAEAHCMKHVWN